MVERLTAMKTSIGRLLGCPFISKESEPTFVETPEGRISRVNLIAAVIDRPGKGSVLLDDGTGRIEARAFDDTSLFDNIAVGDILLLIGRPRLYQERRYVVAEIARRLTSPKWLALRKRELSALVPLAESKGETARETVKVSAAPQPSSTIAAPKAERQTEAKVETKPEARAETKPAETLTRQLDTIIEVIKELDTGSGADVEEVLEKSGATEEALTSLMAEGEIFEIRPGKVKVLE